MVLFSALTLPPGSAGSASHDVASCTATSGTLETAVTFKGPSGVTIAGLVISVEYPSRKVAAPAFSPAAGVGNVTNDEGDRFTAAPIKVSGLPNPFMHATYKTCQGALVAVSSDFKCTVTDASDAGGNVVESRLVSCLVTLPPM
jgi:hypothetical protein